MMYYQGQSVSNFHVHRKHLGTLLKCSLWSRSSGAWGVAFKDLPGNAIAAGPSLTLSIKGISNYFPPSPFFKPSQIPLLSLSFSLMTLLLTTLRKQKHSKDSHNYIQLRIPSASTLSSMCNHKWNIYAPIQNQSHPSCSCSPKGIASGIFSSLLQHYFSSVLDCFHQHDIQTSLFLLS